MAIMKPIDGTLITQARVLRTDSNNIYLDIDGVEGGEKRVDRSSYPAFREAAEGDCYEMRVKTDRAGLNVARLEILAVEEMLFEGRHMRGVSPTELWVELQKLSEVRASKPK
jgi:hypothetical protein